MTDDRTPRRPTYWLRRWAFQESFWREITVGIIANVVVIWLGYIAGFMIGLFKAPERITTFIAFSALVPLILIIAISIEGCLVDKWEGKDSYKTWRAFVIWSSSFVVLIVVEIIVNWPWR